MHIPSAMLHGAVCPVTASLAIIGVAVATYLITRQKRSPQTSKFAMVTSLVFSLQMVNASLGNGLSGHIVGGVLAASLLGTPSGILSMAIVLLLQTLIFADGGILMLGANICNMSLICAGLGGIIYHRILKRSNPNRSLFISSVSSILLAVFAVSIELAVSGRATPQLVSYLFTAHLPIAAAEGVVTILLYHLLKAITLDTTTDRVRWIIYAIVIIGALLITPISSTSPDALEGTLAHFHLLSEVPNFVHAPLADYQMFFLSGPFSTLAASFIGILVVFIISIIIDHFMKALVKTE